MTAFMRVAIPLSIGLTLVLTLLSAAHGADAKTALTVVVAPLQAGQMDSVITATGSVVAWREMPIGTEASGLAVIEVAVDEGDTVTKGQVLARLNRSVLSAQIAQQMATVTEAEATLANAQSDQRRARTVSRGVLSEQTIEQRETLVKTATAKLAAARAVLDETQARLAQTDIVAPASGIVTMRTVTLGQVVQTGTELFRLIQDSRIEVNALVPEGDLLGVKPQQTVQIIDPTGRASEGSVRLVAPIVDARTRLGTVHVALPPATNLKPGMFVRVEIRTNGAKALTVPQKALVWRDGRAAVFTVGDDGTATMKTVKTGRKTSDAVEILDGVFAGERIVVEGAGLLSDGDRVRAEVASVQTMTGASP